MKVDPDTRLKMKIITLRHKIQVAHDDIRSLERALAKTIAQRAILQASLPEPTEAEKIALESISTLGLSRQSFISMNIMGLSTLGELMSHSETSLASLHAVDQIVLKEIIAALQARGLRLASHPTPD